MADEKTPLIKGSDQQDHGPDVRFDVSSQSGQPNYDFQHPSAPPYAEAGSSAQPGYPPQQPGYPPQQPSYAPQAYQSQAQPGYPPQQGYQQQPGYPPQQSGYQQQPGYPPQQPGYPPQQGYQAPPPPQKGSAFPPTNASLPDGVASAPPPPYEIASAQGNLPSQTMEALPPNYFDISIVPIMNVLTPQTAPPVDGPSTVKFERHGENNIRSCDERLDANPDEVWRFFVSHLEKPAMTVSISGTHTETRHRHITERDSNGHSHTRHETYTETVTDFSLFLDVTHYISPAWSRIVHIGGGTIRHCIEEYTQSTNYFKEIVMTKQLLWDYNSLTRAIEYAIRLTGYNHSIHVNYNMSGSEVMAYSSAVVSRMAHNRCVQCLCVVTCLCIIFAPIYYLSRKYISKIVVEYPMAITPNDFFVRNHAVIFATVVSRRIGVRAQAL